MHRVVDVLIRADRRLRPNSGLMTMATGPTSVFADTPTSPRFQ